MDYLLENLGPERFQEVCQALLAKAFPKTQCFPVGQRDGGRDAIAMQHSLFDLDSDGFIVFQVKFSRKPLAEQSPHEWLLKILKEEVPKLAQLIPRGATQYFLLTNIPSTAYPKSGSIDMAQELLDHNAPIPSQCWWREDLNRRLDDAWSIKWTYPEILAGPDILRYIIENGLREDASRRTSAIRAYLRDQYERDTDVRFKQVELQNKLLDLFIDVPIKIRESESLRASRGYAESIFQYLAREISIGSDDPTSREYVGSGTLLLHPLAQKHLTRVVIEGAPGQGKSTVVQYICQIHRQRILEEGLKDERVPEAHRRNPVRLPLKVDCRDLSQWLNRRNPFSAEYPEQVPADWQKSLESFLAAQIKNFSGGVNFDIADLHAVLRLCEVIVVFDGLDEVADIDRRRDVVEYITKGVNRLSEIAVSLQTVVTSRPAAFANSPGMPEGTFRYLYLDSITRPLIEQYAEKWLKARRLEGKEASDVRRILRDKLDQPHLRELARNPMQLAILLSLIQTRGGSLPDKRTALYDSYVELFFNRESEKSTVVRDHRDLLIDIHRYLAWTLHVEAQTKQNSGSVSADNLRQLVTDYLEAEGRNCSLANELFTGMVERVVALVSRVQGTYEFEVQPLREYFAARHLYNTAPYSPPGNPLPGTLPDRFDALCRDYFWQNVARFYAGCYSKGELPSLVDSLEELARSSGYKYTSHPQLLAATLLGDWVFAQHPKCMRQVVALVLQGVALRQITSGSRYRPRNSLQLVLPVQNGNEQLVERCFELLEQDQPQDYAFMLVELIRENASRDVALPKWTESVLKTSGTRRTKWIEYGLWLGLMGRVPSALIERLLDEELPERLVTVLHGRRQDVVETCPSRFQLVLDYLLAANPETGYRRGPSVLEQFVQMLHPRLYSLSYGNRQPVPLLSLWLQTHMVVEPPKEERVDREGPKHELARRCLEVMNLVQTLADCPASDWATKLDPWNKLVDGARTRFGERWAFYLLAAASAGIRSKEELCEDASNLHDDSIPLCRRARYARLRAAAPSWWEDQLKAARCPDHLVFALLVVLVWGGPTVLAKNFALIDSKLNELSVPMWLKLIDIVQLRSFLDGDRREANVSLGTLRTPSLGRGVVGVSCRMDDSLTDSVFQKQINGYDGDDPAILDFCLKSALRIALEEPKAWQKWLPVVARCYSKGATAEDYVSYRLAHAVGQENMPRHIAEAIVQRAQLYPTELVALAEETCRAAVANSVVPVGQVAASQNWFSL